MDGEKSSSKKQLAYILVIQFNFFYFSIIFIKIYSHIQKCFAKKNEKKIKIFHTFELQEEAANKVVIIFLVVMVWLPWRLQDSMCALLTNMIFLIFFHRTDFPRTQQMFIHIERM